MSTFYQNSASTALNLIKSFGRKVTLARYSKQYNPTTGVEQNNVKEQGQIDCVVLPAKAASSAVAQGSADDFISSSLLASKIRFLLVASKTLPFQPTVNDVVTMDGYYWHVIGCTEVNPAGTPVVHKLGIYKGGASSGAVSAVPISDLENLVANFTQIVSNFA